MFYHVYPQDGQKQFFAHDTKIIQEAESAAEAHQLP